MKHLIAACWLLLAELLCPPGKAEAQFKQVPSELMQKGKEDYDHKQYSSSAKLYGQAIALITDKAVGSSRYMAAYNSACSWALARQADSAFAVLGKIATEESFGTYYSQMLKDNDFDSLHPDKRWGLICATVRRSDELIQDKRKKRLADLIDPAKRVGHSLLQDSSYWIKQAAHLSANELIRKIRLFNSFPAAPKKNSWSLYQLKVNDTLLVPFLVHIPRYYDPYKKTPLYVFLHGGVGRQSFSDPIGETELETPLLKKLLPKTLLSSCLLLIKTSTGCIISSALRLFLKRLPKQKHYTISMTIRYSLAATPMVPVVRSGLQ